VGGDKAAPRRFAFLDRHLDPPGVLGHVCSRLGLQFDPAMLGWSPGPKPEDGPWAPHWYANVHRSTGFAPYRQPARDFPAELAELLEECEPYYRRLRRHALSGSTGDWREQIQRIEARCEWGFAVARLRPDSLSTSSAPSTRHRRHRPHMPTAGRSAA
jgi:hypothetical protein